MFNYILEYIEYNIKEYIINNFSINNKINESIVKILVKYGELNYNMVSTYKNVIYNFVRDNILMSDVLETFYDKFSLMETMLLMDGVISSIYFLKDFLILKVSARKLSKEAIIAYNEEIVIKSNKVYRLSTIDRYLFYLIIYFVYNSINYVYSENRYSYIFIVCITVPYVQELFFSVHYVDKILKQYINNKDIFMKYSVAKLTIWFIQNLHPQIEKIQNYHIFIIYKLLSTKFIITIITNCLFILLLNILRSYDSTYYYYKGIKMAYYYNVGYLYNIIPIQDAIYLVNIIIKEKRWKELEKLEVLNALFILITCKYELFSTFKGSVWTNIMLTLLKISSLYSFVSILKIINLYTLGVLLFVGYVIKFSVKNVITSIFLYFLIIFNINNLLITFMLIIHKIIYYYLEEIFFFIKNIKNIKKIIKVYDKYPSISKMKDEYVVI